jgi:hypothetical protein
VNTHCDHTAATTTTTTAVAAATAPPSTLELLRSGAEIRHGRAVWLIGPDGDEGALAEGHDHRALAAINTLGREEYCRDWAAARLPAERLWVLLTDTCGCTPEQHTDHDHRAITDPDWDDCPCPDDRCGLPPCQPDVFAWRYTRANADTPGAVAVTLVTS